MINSDGSPIAVYLLAATFALLSACGKGENSMEQPPAQTPQSMPAQPSGEPAEPQEQSGTMEQAPEPSAQAQQQAASSSTPLAANQGGDVRTVMQQSGCFGCHSVEKKVVGPAYSWVAYRYKDDPNAAQALAKSILSGSKGKWTQVTGGVQMPPNQRVNPEQAKEMAQWVLAREPQPPPQG